MSLNALTSSDLPATTAGRVPRIILVDRHRLVREAVRFMVDATAEFEVIGEAADAAEALPLIDSLQPDVVLTDFPLPDRVGVQFIAEFRSRLPGLQVLVLTALPGRENAVVAMKLGARGYLLKNCNSPELLAAIRSVAAGRPYLCKSLADPKSHSWESEERGRGGIAATNLTERQRLVLRSVALGHSNRDIARILGVSIQAIQKHRERLCDALDLHGTAALTRYALQTGLLPERTDLPLA
jgi:DNA-binding NarL/FixJ family response regulator